MLPEEAAICDVPAKRDQCAAPQFDVPSPVLFRAAPARAVAVPVLRTNYARPTRAETDNDRLRSMAHLPISRRGPDGDDGDGDGDGQWTRVRRKKQRGQRPPPPLLSEPPPPPPPPTATSAAQLAAQHGRLRAGWRAQPAFRRLADLVLAHCAAHAPVARAVCLGTGSFDPAGHDGGVRDRIRCAHVQADAFLAVVDLLSARRLPSYSPPSYSPSFLFPLLPPLPTPSGCD